MAGLMVTFTRHFSPVDGGYLYFAGPEQGGKLVTTDEYARLVEGWRRVAGLGGLLKMFGLAVVALLFLALAAGFKVLPGWVAPVLPWLMMLSIWGWIMRAAAAPGRLVKDRPTVAPPRPAIRG